MKNKLIVIAGYPAAGKTTFAMKLSTTLALPFFNLDSIKTAIGKEIEISNWENSVRFGKASFFVLMSVLESITKANKPLIIENSFIREHETAIKYLLEKYEYETLTYVFKCKLEVLHKRFLEREYSHERESGNKIFGLWNDFQVFERAMKPFDDFKLGGKTINIDTSDFTKIDFDEYVRTSKEFMFDH